MAAPDRRTGGRVGFVELLPPGVRPTPGANGVAGLRAARALHCETVVVTAHRDRLEPVVGELVDTWIDCDTTSADSVADAVAGRRLDALISWADPFAGIAQQAATRLRLDTANPDWPTNGWNDKAAVRARLDDHGLNNARWSVIAPHHDLAAMPLPAPAVVKPVDGFSSLDTVRAATLAELRQAVAAHRRRTGYGDAVTPAGRLICEQELQGPLVSAEGMAVDGRLEIWGHTDRTLSPPPHYVETSVAFSAEPLHPDLDDYAAAVCKALGYRNGPFHFEAVLTDTGPVLVEINTRLVGAGIHRAIDLATSASCAEQVLRGYLGLPLLPPRADGAACLAHLTIPADGRVEAVEGIDAARTSPGVHDVVCSTAVGDTVTTTGSNTDRLCYVLATGETRHEARLAARNAAGKIGITTGPYA
ncbi:ATP-grasp domain-containing protein [Streptomyces sp. NBC_00258]|uniref:ATP-grasp domain-containing protein n=1 Tax=Streptomyces sp. NBC_00258 TaxID=2903642 RepID=UPI002E2E0C8B|nr:ATP-grasp domain-containing protein [Streptomyces sp. NBC_00258]